LARINLWTFSLPGLTNRLEALEPNIDFELQRLSNELGRKISLTREAREEFLNLGTSPAAVWSTNFRDLNAAMTRMATLAAGGRIDFDQVREEWSRLNSGWSAIENQSTTGTLRQHLKQQRIQELDLFDQSQLAAVLEVCSQSTSLAAASRRLFAVSRAQRVSKNESDRLRMYLARFELTWQDIRASSAEKA